MQALTRFLDCNAFILSYRGYGRSEGTPSERVRHMLSAARLPAML
jgi:hypothetical protein